MKFSAEGELCGIVRTTCESLGIVLLLGDLGTHGKAGLHMDATAAQGVAERHSISKIRHLDVNVFWLREQRARDALLLSKALGAENNADLMTKHLHSEMIKKHVARMNK